MNEVHKKCDHIKQDGTTALNALWREIPGNMIERYGAECELCKVTLFFEKKDCKTQAIKVG